MYPCSLSHFSGAALDLAALNSHCIWPEGPLTYKNALRAPEETTRAQKHPDIAENKLQKSVISRPRSREGRRDHTDPAPQLAATKKPSRRRQRHPRTPELNSRLWL